MRHVKGILEWFLIMTAIIVWVLALIGACLLAIAGDESGNPFQAIGGAVLVILWIATTIHLLSVE